MRKTECVNFDFLWVILLTTQLCTELSNYVTVARVAWPCQNLDETPSGW